MSVVTVTREDWGKLTLRLAVGGLMLFHGVDKLKHGVDGIEAALIGQGLPAAMAYGVYVGEILAPLLILIGVLTRPAGAVLAFNMAVAIYTAHLGDLGSLGEHGSWAVELPMFYLLGGVTLALIGAGRIGLGRH
jgi:putative oxidoreductase